MKNKPTKKNIPVKVERQEVKRRRIGRRKMAWTAMVSMLVATICIFFIVSRERLDLLDDTITWFYTIMGSIVLTYTGAATFFDVKNIRNQKIQQTQPEEAESDSSESEETEE